MASKVKYTPSEAGSLGLGQAGSSVITSSSSSTPKTGVYVALTVLDPCKFSSLTPEDSYFISDTDIGAATEIPAGITLYGRWTEVTISAGMIIGYNG